MVKVLIADDHAIVYEGLKLILEATGMFNIANRVVNGDDLLTRLTENNQQYDMVILDISMPGKEPFAVIQEIKALNQTLPVVIFTMNPEELYALRFFKLGASAFIKKDSQPMEIIRILGIVSTGRKYYSPSQVDMLAESAGINPDNRKTHNNLTNREIQVLNLLATGNIKGEIARKLDVSKNTVSNHRNNILKKLNLRNNAELTRFAILNGLIS